MNYEYQAVDISRWQGTWRDPSRLRASGVDFLYMRGTNGTRVDSRVREYAKIARSIDMPFGIYCFFRPKHDPIAQARFLVDLHNELGCTLVPQLDIEHTDGLNRDEVTHRVVLFVNEVDRLIGKKALIYSAAWWWNPSMHPNQIDYTDRPLWVARYVSRSQTPPFDAARWADWAAKFNKQPALPQDWPEAGAWQFSADGNGMGKPMGFSSSALDLNVVTADFYRQVSLKPIPAPKPAPVQRRAIRRGSKGALVVELQTRLKALGFYRWRADGKFGPFTERAVRNYQRSRGLVVDGWVGNQTWRSLDS